MCGKFTQMASWAEIVAFSRALTEPPRPKAGGGGEGGGGERGGGSGEGGNDASVVATPMRFASIMRLDTKGAREMVPMRWGFSKPGAASPARPDYMHARAETVDVRPAFAASFRERRGLCFVRTFNEGEEIGSRTRQWTVTPKDGRPLAIAVIYEEWRNGDLSLLTFVQVTTAANALIAPITDRMPAILPERDWPLWLGETAAPLAAVKAALVTFEDRGAWDFAPEPPRQPRRRA